MIVHIEKAERDVMEKIVPLLDGLPFPVIGPTVTKLLGLVIVGAHEDNPDGDVWKVFNASVEMIRSMIEEHLAQQAEDAALARKHDA